MGMTRNNICRDEVIRLLFLKNELKLILLKNVIKNQQTNNTYRGLCTYKIQRLHLYKSRQNNVCIQTGKIGSNYKVCGLSRQSFNKKLKEGQMNLFKNK